MRSATRGSGWLEVFTTEVDDALTLWDLTAVPGGIVGLASEEGEFHATLFDSSTSTGQTIAHPPRQPEVAANAVWTGSELLIDSGWMAAWNPEDDSWRSIETPSWRSEAARSTAVINADNRIVVLGTHSSGLDGRFAYAYDDGLACCSEFDPPPFHSDIAKAFWTGEEVLLLGWNPGSRSDSELAGLNIATGTWTSYESPTLPSGSLLDAAWVDDSLIAWDRTGAASVWRRGTGWADLPDIPTGSTDCGSVSTSFGSNLFVASCGEVAIWNGLASRWVRAVNLNPGSWGACLSTLGTTSQLQEQRVFIWCVEDGTESLWRFDSAAYESGGWSSPSAVSREPPTWELLPNPRADRLASTTLVWSGAELLWFGGHGLVEESDIGWGYRYPDGPMHRIPAAPYPGRFGQSAVWLNSDMYVFRGPITAWNPVTLQWRTIAPPPAFTRQMLTIGDRFAIVDLSDSSERSGAIYDPATDTWSDIPVAPIPRATEQRLVLGWSGSELFVFDDGHDTVTATRRPPTSARYNPETQTWVELPTIPEDIELSDAVGDWVGDEFVVFGANFSGQSRNGEFSLVPLIAGIAYSPESDSWRTITPPDGPNFLREGWASSMSATEHFGELAVLFPGEHFGIDAGRIGFYDPTTDNWHYVDGAPASAHDPTLVSGETSDGLHFIAFHTPDGTVLLRDH